MKLGKEKRENKAHPRCARGEKSERGKKPYECPNCERKGPFEALEGPYQFFDDSGFCAKKLADEIQENYSFVTHRVTEEIYVYEKGVYNPNGESIIREYRKKLESNGEIRQYDQLETSDNRKYPAEKTKNQETKEGAESKENEDNITNIPVRPSESTEKAQEIAQENEEEDETII